MIINFLLSFTSIFIASGTRSSVCVSFFFCISKNNCAHRHCRKYRCRFSFTTMRRIIMRSWLYSGSIDICDLVRIQSEPIDLQETYHVDEKKTTTVHSRATQLRGVSRINTREGRLTSFWYRYHHNPIMDNYDHYDSKDSIAIAKRKSSAGWWWTFNSLNFHSEIVSNNYYTHIYGCFEYLRRWTWVPLCRNYSPRWFVIESSKTDPSAAWFSACWWSRVSVDVWIQTSIFSRKSCPLSSVATYNDSK